MNTRSLHTSPVTSCNTITSDARWNGLVDDVLVPLPRRLVNAQLVLDQSGTKPGFLLVRDHNSPDDQVFAPEDEIDLAEGNVFRTIPACEGTPNGRCKAPPKLVLFLNDRWELTTNPNQTKESLLRLFGRKSIVLLRDYESPRDEVITDGEQIKFSDGPVFITREIPLTIKITVTVNGQQVTLDQRSLSALELKRTAMKQGVNIQEDFVLYRVKENGDLSASISDDVQIEISQCDAFRCVAPDDNS